MASVPQTVGDKQLVTLGGDERIEIISAGGLRQVVTLQQIADFIGGGPVTVTTVPNGGTGLSSITLNGVMYGNGVNPVGVTAAGVEGDLFVAGPGGVPQWLSTVGTAGQVLTSSGVGALPVWAAGGGGVYPPTPTPDFATYLEAQFVAGNNVNWIWGNVVLDAPAIVRLNQNSNGFIVNLNGATISASNSYPVNTAVDMVTFVVEDSAPSTNIVCFRLTNGVFIGLNPGSASVCRNVVAIACHLNASGIYGGSVSYCTFIGATRSGLQYYGSVFEHDHAYCMGRDNGFAGMEMRNPNGAGAGVISSIKIWGGDYRTNKYGIASTAETSFQEAVGFHIWGSDFIVNNSAGILATSGVAAVTGCHFENNCISNAGETTGSIWVPGGFCQLYNCDNAFNFSSGVYLLDITAAGGGSVIYDGCGSLNENTGVPHAIGRLVGAGSLWIENFDDPTHYDGVGGWSVFKNAATATTV